MRKNFSPRAARIARKHSSVRFSHRCPRNLMESGIGAHGDFSETRCIASPRALRRASNADFSTRKRKNTLTLFGIFITHSLTQRVMILSPYSQKISATRYCGLKGGIIHGD
jgi:hypothetical protein